ncbi:MAG: GIN domain-containing protein [Rhizomicrobium sp.]
MRTKLAIIAVSGFAISAVCLGGALALGGHALGTAVFGTDLASLADLPRCDTKAQPVATASSRSLPWDGNGDRAAVALPANVHYQAGSGDQLVVKGDPDFVAHIRVKDGLVSLDCNGNFHFNKDDRIDVTLPGRRTFKSFALLGTGDVQLSGLSQPEVKLSIAGAGDIRADGKTDNLKVDVRGSGNLKLGDLAAKTVDVDIKGSGKAEVAPEDSLNVDLAGSGTIYLRREPKKIETSIHGSGHIVHPDGTSQGGRSYERHARAEDAAIRMAVLKALENDDDMDRDDMERAKHRLKERIRPRVAQELANEEQP